MPGDLLGNPAHDDAASRLNKHFDLISTEGSSRTEAFLSVSRSLSPTRPSSAQTVSIPGQAPPKVQPFEPGRLRSSLNLNFHLADRPLEIEETEAKREDLASLMYQASRALEDQFNGPKDAPDLDRPQIGISRQQIREKQSSAHIKPFHQQNYQPRQQHIYSTAHHGRSDT
jgi:hypothetical protein